MKSSAHSTQLSVNSSRVAQKPGRQLVKFAIVGSSGTVVDFAIYTALTRIGGLDYLSARVLSVAAAIINNFYLNKVWTFESRWSANTKAEGVKFVIVSLIGMAINLAIMVTILEFTPVYKLLFSYSDFFAMAVGIGCAFLCSFYLNRKWTFKPRPESLEA